MLSLGAHNIDFIKSHA